MNLNALLCGNRRGGSSLAPTLSTQAGFRRVRQRRFLDVAPNSPIEEDAMRERDSRTENGAHNQALIREVNEQIERLAHDAANPEFLCECANPDCIETLQLSIAEYESIRTSPTRFPIKAGHENLEFERVVEESERFIVVEKFGEAAEVVRKVDPRSHA